MSRIFWDTNLFIYLFEDYGTFSKAVAELRAKMLVRGDQLLTSTLTLGEILVKPIERSNLELCGRYERAISAAAIMIPFDVKAAKVYAALTIGGVAQGARLPLAPKPIVRALRPAPVDNKTRRA